MCPFPLKRKINDVAYELELTELFQIHHVFHVYLQKSMITDPFPDWRTGSPAPVLTDTMKEFEVESILDCNRRGSSNPVSDQMYGLRPQKKLVGT